MTQETTAPPAEAPLLSTQCRYNGKVYTLGSFKPNELVVAVEKHLRAQMREPLETLKEMKKDADPQIFQAMMKMAWDDMKIKGSKLTRTHCADWMNTREGMQWILAYLFRKNHPEMTEELAGEIYFSMLEDEVQKLIDTANKEVIARANKLAANRARAEE